LFALLCRRRPPKMVTSDKARHHIELVIVARRQLASMAPVNLSSVSCRSGRSDFVKKHKTCPCPLALFFFLARGFSDFPPVFSSIFFFLPRKKKKKVRKRKEKKKPQRKKKKKERKKEKHHM
jgi:hypothetical protein